MAEALKDSTYETEEERAWAEVAFRKGSVDDWDEPEESYQICDRICRSLGLNRNTPEMRLIGDVESERQKDLFHERLLREVQFEENREYRERMGGVALQLVEALVPQDDSRDREALADSVLEALRPLDQRFIRIEPHGPLR